MYKDLSSRSINQLNWCGRGEKTGLKSRPIHQVLLSSVLKNPAQQNSTEADAEMTVRNWLRLSRDRNGGGKGIN
ncbi:hypothetical protein AALO_G00181720 [Alosa alosa]|uniref:Uncharacterized protein n=1 Tax=Alosa alosa TaxID=278164 RepID=A0AAV6G966_9TELE|nr:hypothetical protein AALO_G00181720 [Alosa alosa]